MKPSNLIKNLEWTLQVSPEKYAPNQYIVYSESFGIFTKKEAEFLASQLRSGLVLSIVNKALMQ